ncbi:MAG: quinoprotein relay system zinc metallohydrolase 2, partial [Methylococcales bacterium]
AIKAATDKKICYVINTHVHPDHIFGNIAFKTSGVTFVGHTKLNRAMTMRGGYYLQLADRLMGLKFGEQHLIPPQLTVKDEKRLNLGGRELILKAHPTAHTDNDLTIYDARTKTLWLSDLLFREHIPVIDGSINGWISELKKLETRTDVKLAIPGHGAVVKNWPSGLKKEQAYLEMLRQEIRVKIKNGEYLEDAVKSVGLSAKKEWKLFEGFHRKNVTTAFAELEWE